MQSFVSFGDTVYIQNPNNIILFTNGFYDDKIFAGASANIVRSEFKAGHFVLLPPLLCNIEDRNLVSKLFEQLQVLNATEKIVPSLKPQGQLIEVDTPEPSLVDFGGKKDGEQGEEEADADQPEDAALLPSKDKSKKPKIDTRTTTPMNGFDYLYKEFQGKQAIEDLKSERISQLNHRTLEAKLGKPIKYGEKVLILHYESQQFLCSTDLPNEMDHDLVKLSLSKYLNQRCYFKFDVPKSYGNLGELIGYETPLSIMTNERNYVTFSSEPADKKFDKPEIKKYFTQNLNQNPEDPLLQDKFFPQDSVRAEFQHNTFDQVFMVGISKLAVADHFKLSKYVTYKERLEINKTKIVKNGDFVRIVSRQNFLTATKTPYEERFFYESNDDKTYPNVCVQSIFQVVQLDEKKCFNTSKLPIASYLSTKTRKEAYELPSDKGFILKHAFTGLALGNPDHATPLKPLGNGGPGDSLSKVHLFGQIPEAEIPLIRGTNVFVRLVLDDQSTQAVFLDDGSDVSTLKEDVDIDTKYYCGFKEPADSITNHIKVNRKKPVMKTYLPTLVKVAQVSDEEAYMVNFNVNFAKQLKSFYLDLIQAINAGEFINPDDLVEFNSKCETYYKGLFLKKKDDKFLYNLHFSEADVQTTVAVDKDNQIYARETKVIDLCNKILFYLCLKPDVHIEYDKNDINSTRITKELTNTVQVTVKLLADIILATTQNNEVNHLYNAQFLKIYLNLIINPEGMFGRLPHVEVNASRIKDMILPLLLEFLHPDDLSGLRLVNRYSEHLFSYLENQRDFEIHVLQLLHHVFNTDTPSFEQIVRNQFMDDYLADATRFRNFVPEIAVHDGSIVFIFRRAGRQPVELPLKQLQEGVIQTTYLKWVLKILVSLARRGSKNFTVKIASYYQQNLCEEVASDTFIFYEIKGLMLKLVEVFHLSYKALPTEAISTTIRILSRDEQKYMDELAQIISAAKRNLTGEFEKEILVKGGVYPEAGKKAAVTAYNYLSFLDVKTFKFNEFLVAFSSMPSILNDPTQDKLDNLAYLHHLIWKILKLTLSHDNEAEVKATLRAAIPLLTRIEERMLPHLVNEATNKIIQSQQLQQDKRPFSVRGVIPDLAEKFAGATNQIVKEFMSEEWISKRGIYTLAQQSLQNLEAFPNDVTYPLIIGFMNRGLDLESQRILLKYLESGTKYKTRFLEMVAANPLIDDENDIRDFIRLVELLLEMNRITRELSAIDAFRSTEINKAKVETDTEQLVQILSEILTIVYDYATHMKSSYPQFKASERKELFLKFLLKEKRKDSPIPFLVKKEASVQMWQSVMRLINADSILLATADTLGASGTLANILLNSENAKLAARLIMIVMLVFVFENNENQQRLADNRTFLALIVSKSPKLKDFFGVDLEILFVETVRGNQELMKMNKSHLKDVAISVFIKEIDLKFKYDPKADYNRLIAQTKSMNFILTSKFPNHIWKLDTRLLEEFNELIVAIFENDIFSLKALSSKSQQEYTREYQLPPFYYAFEEMLHSIEALVDQSTPSGIAFLQTEYVRDSFIKLLTNPNLMIHFNMKKVIFNLFDKIFYKKFRKPGVFKNTKQAYAFFSIVLADLAAYVDSKNKLGNVGNPFLLQIRDKGWFAGAPEQKILLEYLTDFDQTLEFPEFEKISFLYCLDNEFINTQWVNCLKSGTIPLLITLLIEEREVFSDQENDIVSLVVDISEALQGINQANKKVREATSDLCNSIIPLKEYVHWKERLAKLAYKHPGEKTEVKASESKLRTSLSDALKSAANAALQNTEDYELEQIRLFIDTSKDPMILSANILDFIRSDIIGNPILSEQALYCVKLLIELIKAQNSDPAERIQPIYKWHELKDWTAIKELQTYLSENGLPELILAIIHSNHQSKVATSLFDLATCLLYGGNEEVQDKFYLLLSQDPENQFLGNLHRIFVKKLQLMKNIESARVKKLYTESQKLIFFHMQEKTSILSSQEIEEHKLIMEKNYFDTLPASDKISVEDYAQDLLLLMKLLQSLCEGHHGNFQEFLREQKFEGKKLVYSINFLDIFKRTYHDFLSYMSIFNIEFGIRLMDVMIETIQGENRANAYVFLENTLVNDLTNTLRIYDGDLDIISRGFVNKENRQLYIELKDKALCLLLNMVEGSNPEKIEEIRPHFNVEYAVRTLYGFLKDFFREKGFVFTTNLVTNTKAIRKILKRLTLEENRGVLRSSLTIYSILKHLWGESKDFQEFVASKAETAGLNDIEMKEFRLYVSTFCEEYCLSIEILTKRNPDLVRVYFPKLTICNILESDDSLTKFYENVDRSNTQSKVEALVKETNKMIPAMYAAHKNMGYSFNASKLYNLSVTISEVLAIVINIFILATVTYDTDTDTVNEGTTSQKLALYIMIGVQAFIALVQIVCFVLSHSGTVASAKWTDRVEQKREELGPEMMHEIDITFKTTKDFTFIDDKFCDAILDLKGPFSEEYETLAKQNEYIRKQKTLLDIKFIVSSPMFIWQLIFFVICCLSEYRAYWCAFQTLNWVVRSDSVKRVAMAISENTRQFLWTLLLLLIAIFIYSILGFYFFNDLFVDSDTGTAMCTDTFMCFFWTLNLGLRNGGGIGDSIGERAYDEANPWGYVASVLYDLSFFVIVIILLMNVIFGMIIDAFGQLRDMKNANEEDAMNVCFICGLDRGEYERRASFDAHTANEHNVKNYIYYLTYVLEKEKTESVDLTDIESYVLEYVHKSDNRWFPIGRSITFEAMSNESSEGDESAKNTAKIVMQKIERMSGSMEIMSQQIKEIKDSVENQKKK